MTKEPLVSAAVVTSIVGAVLALLSSFGVPLTTGQQAAISGLALVVSPLLVALVVRPKVTPVAAPADDGYGLVQVLVVIALLLVILFLGAQLFDVSFKG